MSRPAQEVSTEDQFEQAPPPAGVVSKAVKEESVRRWPMVVNAFRVVVPQSLTPVPGRRRA